VFLPLEAKGETGGGADHARPSPAKMPMAVKNQKMEADKHQLSGPTAFAHRKSEPWRANGKPIRKYDCAGEMR